MMRGPRGVRAVPCRGLCSVVVAALFGVCVAPPAHALSARSTSNRSEPGAGTGRTVRGEREKRTTKESSRQRPASEKPPNERAAKEQDARERAEPGKTTSDREQRRAPTTATKDREERRISLVRTKGDDDAPARGQKGKGKDAKKRERKIRPLPPGATWTKYRAAPWKRGYVTVEGHGKKWSGFLVDASGDVIPASRRAISEALSSWRTGRQLLMDERLLQLIADVSDEFGGRTVRIVSGYREHSYAPDSKHKTGEAFDFSVPGVPNELMRDFLKSFPDVGVGFYPNSTHVHLDVRDKKTYWVDYSRPGEHPVYSYARRQRGQMTPAERALASALDAIAAHPLRAERLSKIAPREDEKTPAPAPQRTHREPARAQPAASRETADGGAPRDAGAIPDAGRASAAPDAGR